MQKDSVDGRNGDNGVCSLSPSKYSCLAPPVGYIRHLTMLVDRKGCHVVAVTGTRVEKWLHHWLGI